MKSISNDSPRFLNPDKISIDRECGAVLLDWSIMAAVQKEKKRAASSPLHPFTPRASAMDPLRNNKDYHAIILSYDYRILKPYLWGPELHANYIYNKKYLKNNNSLNPVAIGMATFFLLKEAYYSNDKKTIQLAKEYLGLLSNEKSFIDERENSMLWKYNYKWRELDPGWWSSLANSVIALSFLSAWQQFGLKRYKDIAGKAINGVILPIEKGGSTLWLDENSCWFFEYAHKNLMKDNGYYVLNGFLVSLLTVRLYADVTGNEKMRKMYQCGLNGLKKMVSQFYNKEITWTYYMLNPLTPESTHYFIFEMMLYESLYNLTHEDFYLQQLEIYRNFFKANYPLDIYQEDNNEYFLFSLIGPPNPYWLDTYPIRIDFLDDQGEIIETKEAKYPRDKNKHIKEKAFIHGKVEKIFNKYKIYSCYGKREHLLYEDTIKNANRPLINGACMPESVKYNLRCAYDAVWKDNQSVKILPSIITVPKNKNHYTNNQGVLVFSVSSLNLLKYKHIGFVVNPSDNLRSIRFCLHDIDGNVTCRYYVELQANVDNFILLDLSGFKNHNLKFNLIQQIHLIIPTSDSFHINEFNITLKKFLGFRNNVELYNFVRNEEFYFPEKPLPLD
jgi:hypothetical protein